MEKTRHFIVSITRHDNSRAAQVRNMGMVDGNTPVSDNDWETVTKGGVAAIKKWITDQMQGRSCTVVLVGSRTARPKVDKPRNPQVLGR